VEKREELESALAASWDRDTLAVYADHLQAEGDPRGELIALDLEIDARGSTVELSKRRTSLLYAWLGSLVPVDNVHAPWIGDSLKCGFVENLVPANLERALASPIGPYVRGVTLRDSIDELERKLAVLARHEHRWLVRMTIGDTGSHRAPVDPDIARRAFAAMPRLHTLELVHGPALALLSHPTIERLVVHGRSCFDALGDGATFARVTDLVITHVAEPAAYDDAYGDENYVEEAPPPAQAAWPKVAFPALRRLELADTDLDAAYKLVRSLDARAHVTTLRIPRLRNAADRDELIAIARDMPALAVVEIAHGTHYDPPDIPNLRLERAELLAWPMQDEAESQGLRVFMPGSKYGETVALIDAIYVMEQRFEALPAAARAAWSQLWRRIAALNEPIAFPARVLADAVESVPELMQNGWRELREELSARRPLAADAMVKIERR
jgi:hypothetical protein